MRPTFAAPTRLKWRAHVTRLPPLSLSGPITFPPASPATGLKLHRPWPEPSQRISNQVGTLPALLGTPAPASMDAEPPLTFNREFLPCSSYPERAHPHPAFHIARRTFSELAHRDPESSHRIQYVLLRRARPTHGIHASQSRWPSTQFSMSVKSTQRTSSSAGRNTTCPSSNPGTLLSTTIFQGPSTPLVTNSLR